ncbi:AAA family ATPase, partial [Pseudomonas syringae pv. tagetis]
YVIEPLVEHFLYHSSRHIGCPLQGISAAAIELLGQYHWPVNVRLLDIVLFLAVSLFVIYMVQGEHIRLPVYGVRPVGTD